MRSVSEGQNIPRLHGHGQEKTEGLFISQDSDLTGFPVVDYLGNPIARTPRGLVSRGQNILSFQEYGQERTEGIPPLYRNSSRGRLRESIVQESRGIDVTGTEGSEWGPNPHELPIPLPMPINTVNP